MTGGPVLTKLALQGLEWNWIQTQESSREGGQVSSHLLFPQLCGPWWGLGGGGVTRWRWPPGAICGLSHADNRRCWRTGYTREDRCAGVPASFSPDPGLTRTRVGHMDHRQLESLAEEGCQNSGACQAKKEGFFCRMPGQGHVIRREHQL